MRDRVIRVRSLTRRFGPFTALQNIDLDVARGEAHAILGSNGAGKSTLLKVVGCILPPTSGEAWVSGYNILTAPQSVKRVCGYLPEFPVFPERLTGRELIEMVAGLRGMESGRALRTAEGIARRLDMDALDSTVDTYSKGMRQKLSIIVAMFHGPDVLLVDEPTSGLDPRCSRVMKEMLISSRATVLLSTHSSHLAAEVCRSVTILHRGRVVVSGSIGEVRGSVGADDLEEAFIGHIERWGDGCG